ncbi:MAG TPA: hypothetical protein VI756_18010 [Blastocatellia bacterium]
MSRKRRTAQRPVLARVREEFEEPAVVIVAHGLIILFGLGVLSLSAVIADHSPISETAKEVVKRFDEYLMVFAFLLLGIGFIMKIAIVVWGSVLRDIERK